MRTIWKQECKNFLRNPLYWLGILMVLAGVFGTVRQYLGVRYLEEGETLTRLEGHEALAEADVMEGYIPATTEEQYELTCQTIRPLLVENCGIMEAEADALLSEAKRYSGSPREFGHFLEERAGFYDWGSYLLESAYRLGSREEINGYLEEKFTEKPFSYYFSLKVAEFTDVFGVLAAAVLLALLFFRDTRKDVYELLHTKPVSGGVYIAGKTLGGISAMAVLVGVVDLVFTTLILYHGKAEGFPVRAWDLTLDLLLYVMPSMVMVAAVYAAASMVFLNPFPAVPLIGIYYLYSNMGSRGPDGYYGFYGKPLGLLARFDGKFLEPMVYPVMIFNIAGLLAGGILLAALAAWLFQRRRMG